MADAVFARPQPAKAKPEEVERIGGAVLQLDRGGRDRALDLVRAQAIRHFDEPVQLASGEYSHEFVDMKRALAHGDDLRVVCEAMIEAVRDVLRVYAAGQG